MAVPRLPGVVALPRIEIILSSKDRKGEPLGMCDIQTASIWKRISAAVLDFILLSIVAVGFGWLTGRIVRYDEHNAELEQYYTYYETTYHISFEISEEEYNALTDEQRSAYEQAEEALKADEGAKRAFDTVMNLTLVITSVGIFFAFVLLEIVVPLFLRDGRTVGKFVFSLCLVRENCVKVSPVQLVIRALLGKYAIETMVPVYIILMIFFGAVGLPGTLLALGILLLQIILCSVTARHQVLHDLLAGTVCADMATQKIFESAEALAEYKEQISAESSNSSQAGSTEHES